MLSLIESLSFFQHRGPRSSVLNSKRFGLVIVRCFSGGKGKQGKVQQVRSLILCGLVFERLWCEATDKKRKLHDETDQAEHMASPPLPSIYEIASNKRQVKTKEKMENGPKKGEKAAELQKPQKPLGFLGTLEAARSDATKMRVIARPLASARISGLEGMHPCSLFDLCIELFRKV